MNARTLRGPAGTPQVAPLVERERELATVADALDTATGEAGRLLVIEGKPGTGKTRLVEEAAAMADARGMRTLRARGAELERDYAFGLIRQLLESEAAALDTDEGASPAIVAPAVSMLRGAPPDEAPPLDALFAMVNGIYWICAQASERRPTAFLVDDLHWADEPSLRALEYLANRVDELPAALVVSLRTDESGHSVQWVRDLPSGIRISTEPLSEAGSARLLEHLLGSVDPSFAASAHRVTAGNPMLLREVALAVAARGIEPDEAGGERIASLAPASVGTWALARLDGNPQDDHRLVSSVAVLEAPTLRLAAAHAELTEEAARTAADRLAGIGLLDDSLPLRFAHPIVRTALYDGIPPAARDEAHRRAAHILSESGEPPERIASHLLACEPRGEGWAVQALRAHASAAALRGATGEGARSLRRAIAEGGVDGRAGLLLELGMIELTANDPAAIDALSAAIEETAEPATLAAAQAGLAYARYLSGDTLGAFEAARAGLQAMQESQRGGLEAPLLACLGIAGRANPDRIRAVREQLSAEPPDELPATEVVRSQVRALDAFLRGDRSTAADAARRAARGLRDPATLAAVPALLTPGPAFVLSGLGEYEEAVPLVEDALARAARRGSRLETGQALYDRIWMRWRMGELDAALADCDQLFSLTEGAWELAQTPARVAAACMLVEGDDLAGAAEQLELSPGLERRLPGTWGWSWIPYGRAQLAAARGDLGAALDLAEETGARLRALDADSPEYCPWRSLAARAAIGIGEHDRARELAEDELSAARATGSRRAIGISLATLGAARGGAPGVDALAEAEGFLREGNARLELARALVERGMAMRRGRRQREARDPLREGADLALAIGAVRLSELALAELRAAGGKPRRRRSTGAGALTPRERQVAELAASGLPNPEIAQRLFITRKTVEAHLRSIFRKLNISSRDQLSAALRQGPRTIQA
jgi:DNA-binding CsgD family transcriptional regulator